MAANSHKSISVVEHRCSLRRGNSFWCCVLEEHIELLLKTNCGGGAVAWDDLGVLRQREELPPDGLLDFLKVPVNQVCPANVHPEQCVTCADNTELGEVVGGGTFGVSWSVDAQSCDSSKRDLVRGGSLAQKGVRIRGILHWSRDPKGLCLPFEVLPPKLEKRERMKKERKKER